MMLMVSMAANVSDLPRPPPPPVSNDLPQSNEQFYDAPSSLFQTPSSSRIGHTFTNSGMKIPPFPRGRPSTYGRGRGRGRGALNRSY